MSDRTDEQFPELDLQEFMDFGYLQEVNRQFFHLVGLALFVRVDEDGEPIGLGVYDWREEPEGIFFGDEIDTGKSRQVYLEFQPRAALRKRLFKGKGPAQPIELEVTSEMLEAFRESQKPDKNVLNR